MHYVSDLIRHIFNLQQAIEVSKKLNQRKHILLILLMIFFIKKINSTLPKGIELGYDGMEFKL
ncbi:MAG: hypothetical protein R3A12_00705 [Ignavibacteria bacterium]